MRLGVHHCIFRVINSKINERVLNGRYSMSIMAGYTYFSIVYGYILSICRDSLTEILHFANETPEQCNRIYYLSEKYANFFCD